jgi:SAM-dependent methyltransferase
VGCSLRHGARLTRASGASRTSGAEDHDRNVAIRTTLTELHRTENDTPGCAAELAALRDLLDAERRRRIEAEQHVAAIFATKSWRLLAPLRATYGRARRTLHRQARGSESTTHHPMSLPLSRPAGPAGLDRRDKILTAIGRHMRVIELGPSFAPLAPKADGWDVCVVDHLPRPQLIEKYRGHPDVDVSRIEEVDIVWTDEALDAVVPVEWHGTFDACIASHVLEHMPDPLGFLKSMERLLAPTGVVSLAMPDTRFVSISSSRYQQLAPSSQHTVDDQSATHGKPTLTTVPITSAAAARSRGGVDPLTSWCFSTRSRPQSRRSISMERPVGIRMSTVTLGTSLPAASRLSFSSSRHLARSTLTSISHFRRTAANSSSRFAGEPQCQIPPPSSTPDASSFSWRRLPKLESRRNSFSTNARPPVKRLGRLRAQRGSANARLRQPLTSKPP